MAKEIFGIELEVPLRQGVTCNDFRNCLSEAIGRDLVHFTGSNRRVGYHTQEYNENVDKWRVASDGSLSWANGVEIVSRRRTTLAETKKAMEATRHLVDIELLGSTSCGGHHVHIGAMHFSAIKRTYNPEIQEDLDKLVRTKRVKLLDIKIHEVYSYFQPVIDALVSRSRRSTSNNGYCRPVSRHYRRAMDGIDEASIDYKERYLNSRTMKAPLWGNRGVVNFGRIDSYGTIEYRQHQQTYHVATVQNWVKLMHRLTSRCWVQETKNIDPRDFSLTVDGFADFLGLGQNRLRAWMRRRANHFGFSAIARNRGINPVVGSRRRETRIQMTEALVNGNSNTPDDFESLVCRMQSEIELQFSNNENLYRNAMDLLNNCNSPEGEDYKRIFELPSSRMYGEEWFHPLTFDFRVYDGVDWVYLSERITEALME